MITLGGGGLAPGPDDGDTRRPPSRFEAGMEGQPFTRQEVPGAIPNGTRVIVTKALPEHAEYGVRIEAGDRGFVLGSTIITTSDGRPLPEPEIGYYIEWDHLPKAAWSAMADVVEPLQRDSKRREP